MSLPSLQKKLSAGQGLFITDFYNIAYLTGFTGSNGAILITKKEAYFLTDFRYERVAQKILPSQYQLVVTPALYEQLLTYVRPGTTLFFEAKHLSYAQYQMLHKKLPKIKLQSAQHWLEELRSAKTSHEIKLITKAQRIAEKTFWHVVKGLQSGVTEEQVAWHIEMIGREYGADDISFTPIVGFGKNSGSPHHQNSSKKLKKGDIVLIDMGMKYKGYCSDMTRTIFTATPTPLQRRIYETVLHAKRASFQQLKAGVIGSEIDAVARKIIDTAGFGGTFGHSLGHGIGLEVHEAPYLSIGFGNPIPLHSIVTVEPGIYLKNSCGVRIEDMVLIDRDKAINLTAIPDEIEQLIFPIT